MFWSLINDFENSSTSCWSSTILEFYFQNCQTIKEYFTKVMNFTSKRVCKIYEIIIIFFSYFFRKMLQLCFFFVTLRDCRIQSVEEGERNSFYCFTQKWNSGILIFNAMQVSAYEFRIYILFPSNSFELLTFFWGQFSARTSIETKENVLKQFS